jgi:hypothetical protein
VFRNRAEEFAATNCTPTLGVLACYRRTARSTYFRAAAPPEQSVSVIP